MPIKSYFVDQITDKNSEMNSTGATQLKLRTKELEFFHQQLNLPLTVIGPLMKEVQFFCSEHVLWLAK